jgi:plasmid stabilization system protein ParE
MNCRILVTDTAKSDLRDIAVYLADLSKDKNLAIRFIKELQEKTKILEQFPENGATPRDRVLKSNGYRFLVHKDYLIFYLYEKSENTAHIMAVGGRKHDYLCIMKKFL